ncbi:MAG: NAD-dependent epimerase/dehydratase family protein [Verrucomicrobia bacterium]|nr:NAD-dependent epimerase/dehydratase family protein [Verrucomicrobiota bacterium]
MPRALIAGCGYLGQALADLLAANDWGVEGWTTSTESAQQLLDRGIRAQSVDISDEKDVAAHKADFDVVVHCASTRGGDVDLYRQVYFEGAQNLRNHVGGAKFLFTSSTSVYAQINGEIVTEQSPAQPKHETGRILRQAEDLVLAKNGVVVRLGGIYGPGRSALLKRFLSGDSVVDPAQDRFVNQIHRDDAAMGMCLLLKSATAGGEIYNVVDDQPILQSECYHWLASKVNRLAAVERMTSTRKRGESNKRVSNAKLRSIGWIPQYRTFADGMEKSVLPAASSFRSTD